MKRILEFKNSPKIVHTATICGPKEAQGNLGKYIDKHLNDDYNNEKNFERAERKMLLYAIKSVIEKSKKSLDEIDLYIGGDLLNQIISSSFCAREFSLPFLGVYTACATMAESMIIGASLVDSGIINNCVCATCSHFSTAERQYRFPLEQGTTRPPQSQWTVTGAGANMISISNTGVSIKRALVGRVIDYGVTDVNNMGAAMAPAAADTIIRHLADFGRQPDYYDAIITGDLGRYGKSLLKYILSKEGIKLPDTYMDAGAGYFKPEQQTFQGGSGAGCISSVFNGYILNQLESGALGKILVVPTGALLNKDTPLQKETIPGISHAFVVETEKIKKSILKTLKI